MSSTDQDIRTEVDNSRGLLKKIQLLIPGFKGYRQVEDIRVADELLRKQVSTILQMSEQRLMNARSSMASSGNFQSLTQVASALSQLQQFEGELLHSEQGYSGISPSIRVDASKLSSLYDYDYGFVNVASDFGPLCDLSAILASDDQQDLEKRITDIKEMIGKMKYNWEQRIITVEKIRQTTSG